jgi:tetratricopeptide (TPR) repeat protein
MAARTLEQAKAIDPRDAKALLMFGDIRRIATTSAREAYRQALAVEPDLAPAAIGLDWCCSNLGDYVEAAEIFEGLMARGGLPPPTALGIATVASPGSPTNVNRIYHGPSLRLTVQTP